MDNGTFYPFLSPLYLVAKPASSACNMRCEYCYYLEKSKYYPKGTNRMDERMLEMFISRYIAAQNSPDVLFNWHGGEAMLCGTDFFRRALELQRKYGAGHNIVNTIQTNGLLLDRKWCSFFRENGFLVGISLDGPEDCHDMYRKKTGGQGSFADVMRGMEMLKGEGVEFNVLCAVNDYNSRRPLEVYDFFRSTGARFVQFTPVVERTDPSGGLCAGEGAENARLTPWSVLPDTWGRFLCDIFFRWVRNDVSDFFVNIFDAVLAGYVGREPGNCYFAKKCGHALVLEYNGDVYSCDHFVFPEYLLGNIAGDNLRDLRESPAQKTFGEAKTKSLPRTCRQCRYLNICNGECPKNRITPSGEPGRNVNYLCRGYKFFFSRTERYFTFMAGELAAGRNVLAVKDVKF